MSAKKPSRPLPSTTNRRPLQQTNNRSSRNNNRQPPVSASRRRSEFDDEEDGKDESYEADSFDPPMDDEDEEEDASAIQARSAANRKRSSPNRSKPPTSQSPSNSRKQRVPPPSNKKRAPVLRDDDDDEDDDDIVDFEDGDMLDEDEDDFVPPRRGSTPARGAPNRRGPPNRNSRNPNSRGNNNYRRSSGGGGGGRVVPYVKPGQGAAAAFTKGWSAVVSALPDPNTVKEAALSGISAAKQTTSTLSANIYREVKGLTSSELEQVMLKATKPDDTAVKGKHVERLVGVTYQISSRYDIYDAVLRKLWSKMAEKDWRTTIKALYILHRFSADGSPEHAPALKARLRELRRTRDPKRKDKFFNSKQLLAGDASPENIKFRAFMSRYAHYVLLRTQCFSGVFDEISSVPKPDKKKPVAKPITATSLRAENFNAAEMLLKAGILCQLKEGEECENTAIASERVASDMIGLTTAVAIALNRALKDGDLKGADPSLLKKWSVFYRDELLPQTKTMVKKVSPKLDAYGLFLPSRMGTSVSPDLLEKGVTLPDNNVDDVDTKSEKIDDAGDNVSKATVTTNPTSTPEASKEVDVERPAQEEKEVKSAVTSSAAVEVEDDDEYEDEDEEYYDDDDA